MGQFGDWSGQLLDGGRRRGRGFGFDDRFAATVKRTTTLVRAVTTHEQRRNSGGYLTGRTGWPERSVECGDW